MSQSHAAAPMSGGPPKHGCPALGSTPAVLWFAPSGISQLWSMIQLSRPRSFRPISYQKRRGDWERRCDKWIVTTSFLLYSVNIFSAKEHGSNQAVSSFATFQILSYQLANSEMLFLNKWNCFIWYIAGINTTHILHSVHNIRFLNNIYVSELQPP